MCDLMPGPQCELKFEPQAQHVKFLKNSEKNEAEFSVASHNFTPRPTPIDTAGHTRSWTERQLTFRIYILSLLLRCSPVA